jgi:hypothetical protein
LSVKVRERVPCDDFRLLREGIELAMTKTKESIEDQAGGFETRPYKRLGTLLKMREQVLE